MKKNNSLDIS